MMPNQQMRASLFDPEGNPARIPALDGHIWVPIDDENSYVYNIKYCATDATGMTREQFLQSEKRNGRHPEDFIPGTYWLQRNPSNDYLIVRELQRTKTFTGVTGINTQDYALQEGMGGIVRRDLEALGSTDRAISACRELLLEAADSVEQGRSPRGTDPESYRTTRAGEMIIPRGVPWRDATKDLTEAIW